MPYRPLQERLRETLGSRKMLKYFPNPTDRNNPLGNTDKFQEVHDTALGWVSTTVQVPMNMDVVIPASGILNLALGPNSRVREVRHIEQNGLIYRRSMSVYQGPNLIERGAWYVEDGLLFFINLVDPTQLSGFGTYCYQGPAREPAPGDAVMHFFGLATTEADLNDDPSLQEALLQYSVHLILEDLCVRALRDRSFFLEGMPSVKDNVSSIRVQANQAKKSAEDHLDRVYSEVG